MKKLLSPGKPTPSLPNAPFRHLWPDQRYRVAEPFTDYDGRLHPRGGCWTFIGHAFLPYDDGLSLFTQAPDGSVIHTRLQWRPEEQASIIENLEQHIVADGSPQQVGE